MTWDSAVPTKTHPHATVSSPSAFRQLGTFLVLVLPFDTAPAFGY